MSTDLHKIKSALKSITIIEEYVKTMVFEEFIDSNITCDAVLMQLSNMGERLNQLTDDFKEKFTQLPYAESRQMRNWIAHQYDGINKVTVWNTIINELPKLKLELELIISNESK